MLYHSFDSTMGAGIFATAIGVSVGSSNLTIGLQHGIIYSPQVGIFSKNLMLLQLRKFPIVEHAIALCRTQRQWLKGCMQKVYRLVKSIVCSESILALSTKGKRNSCGVDMCQIEPIDSLRYSLSTYYSRNAFYRTRGWTRRARSAEFGLRIVNSSPSVIPAIRPIIIWREFCVSNAIWYSLTANIDLDRCVWSWLLDMAPRSRRTSRGGNTGDCCGSKSTWLEFQPGFTNSRSESTSFVGTT
jgi:hypothetical protein